MFESILQPQPQHPQQMQVAVQPHQGQSQEQYVDPYALPIDPYIASRPSTNMNVQVMSKLFDSSLSAKDIEAGEFSQMLMAIVADARRSPNTSPARVNKWNRDYADIEGLIPCGGTKGKVRSRLRKLWFEVNIQAGDGSNALHGLTPVSAMITQKSDMTQQVKIPTEPVQQRKKVLGIF